MKAAQLTDYGKIDNLKISDNVEVPDLEPGRVLVEVFAASVNPFDVKLVSGIYPGIPPKFPAILGGDVAGRVSKIGSEVQGFEIGQEVFGMANAGGGEGSFAEYTPVKANQLEAKPKTLDFQKAAALPLAGISAYQALIDHVKLQPGQKILIHGGAGGIGSLAIQIAKNIGAYVATTAAADDADFVKELGADEAIDYKTQDFSQLLNDYDAVFDTVGGETNQKSYAILRNGGAFVSMLEAPNEELVKQKSIAYTQQSSHATRARLQAVAELVDSGKLKVHVEKVFPLEQTADAFAYWQDKHPRGKIVIEVRPG